MRPRKSDRHLPPCVYFKHGQYWLVKAGKWKPLGKTLPDALRAYAKAATETNSGAVSALMDRWLEHWKTDQTRTRADSTLKHYKSAIESKIKPAFKLFALGEITPQTIAQFIDHHRKHPNMANRMRTILHLAFQQAVVWGLIPANPVRDIPRYVERKRDRHMEDAEFFAIRDKAPPHLQVIMDVAFYSGQRIGDVLKIRLQDIRDGRLYIKQQKTGAEVWVEITPELNSAIEAAKRIPDIRGMLLFHHGGRQWSYSAIRDHFRQAAEKAGVTDIRLHDLRAKAITEAERQGLNAQVLAGHSDKKMTERYIRDKEIIVARPPSLNRKSQ